MIEFPLTASRASVPRGTLVFFFVAFGITWLLQFPAVLAQRGLLPVAAESLMPLVLLGIFGPTLAAVLVTRAETDGAGVRALFGQLRRWRVGVGWYVVALGFSGTLLAGGMAIASLLPGVGAQPWFYLPDVQRLVAMVIISFAEEIGWRGFALPRLQQSYGPLNASVILGVLWTIWHIPMFMGADMPMRLLPVMVLFFVPGSIVFTWIYNRTGGNLLLMVLAHMGAHLNNSHLPLPGNTTPLVVHTVAFWVAAVGLVVVDRRAWRTIPDSLRPESVPS